ncbi:hypothetical protein MFIFM68171_02001 [Madurella fahalii]|uniref:Protein kinase domain-containing protein n=1 Tax=Madurella fahalii TaxID=1157608 RepID=A0ABQ0G202_9PEZI
MAMTLILGFVGSIRHFLVSAARWAWGLPEPAITEPAATEPAATEPLVIEFLPRTYSADSARGKKRWIKLILRSSRSQWHLKFTFSGTSVQDGTRPIVAKGMKRRNDLRDLCRCVDFRQIPLLDDTVTEVILSLDPSPESVKLPYTTQPSADSEYASIISHLWVCTLEDPLRIRFPVYDSSNGISARRLSEIRVKEELNGDSVYKVLLQGDETPYVYKEVERAHYVPRDTEVLEQELRNLDMFRGTTVGIVQLVAAVVSQNPYQTTQPGKECDPVVLRGFLLEHHPNGTLESALKSPTPETRERWCEWALQIASAFAEMHRRGLAHMDLKPSNVVLSGESDAVLIDISGIGGVTRQWLYPEMLESKKDPLSWGIAAQQQNDIWALGQIILAMADACCADEQKQLLRSVALATTRPCPRIPLSEVIAALSGPAFNLVAI